MKCCAMICRFFRTKLCVYFFILICVLFLGRIFQTRRAAALRAIFYHFPYPRGNTLLLHQFSSENNIPFVPGLFLKSIQPINESYCNFRLGYNIFNDKFEEVDPSPQLGYDGAYRIIYNVIKGTNNESKTITYCSHFTPEFLYHLVEIVIRWEGPVSVSAFVPSTDASITMCLLERICNCVPEMNKVSVHFVFPNEYPPDHIACDPTLSVPQGCFMPDVLVNKKLETFRNTEKLIYPVNVARNVARVSAETTYVLVSDIELIPSKNLVSRFLSMIQRLEERSGSDFRLILKRFVYVLPVFEVENYIYKIPEIKSQLIDLYSQNRAVYFHRWVCLHCQRFPGLQRWIHRKLHVLDNSVQPLLVVRREFPYHRWEPIYIGTNQEPLYSEQLSWEGQQDKMTQMHEMCLLGYKFVILDGAFLVHAPGVKRKSNIAKLTDSRNAHLYQNMHYYDDIIRKVTKLHGAKQQCKIH
uniref:N-acetyllactosaminide beta-1,3-N-acetylglucosaminyltransferase n=1 Tax=Clastoptera arizonana TaxID=38151 RepID=A0A1B6CXQ4_9HEMI